MAVQPLSAADRAYVMQKAAAIAEQQGITPEQALWNYAQDPQNNISPADLDVYMGWPAGTSLQWAVSSGQAPAPQGNFNPASGMPPPPTWQDAFNQFQQAHVAQFGIGIDRPWNSDADAARAKQQIDDAYLKSVQAYNQQYGSNIQPDQSVLGANAQPNQYTPKPESGGLLGTISGWLGTDGSGGGLLGAINDNPLLTAAIVGGLAYMTGGGSLALTSAGEAAGLTEAGLAAGTAEAASAVAAAVPELAGSLGYGGYGTGLLEAGGGLGGAFAAGSELGAAEAALAAAGASGGGGLLSQATQFVKDNPSLVSTGANLVGGILNQNAAKSAAATQADAQIRAAQIAADAAKFRPVGVKTNLGQSQFGYDAQGNLKTAGYTLDPRLQAQQNQLIGAAPGMLNNFTRSQQYLQPMVDAAGRAADIGRVQTNLGEGMLYQASQMRPDVDTIRSQTAPMAAAGQNAMTLGSQYLQTSPQQQAAKYLAEQQALLAPGRAQEMAALQAQMQAQGRGGLMVGGGVNGQLASNPQLNALYNARLQQDAQLAAQATQGGMDYAKFGAGLVDTGGGLMRNMYDTQTAAFKPYDTAQQLAQNQVNYGIGLTGTGGQMLRDMFSTQTAAYAPYQQAMQGAQYLEGLGQNAMGLGIDIGAKGTAANAAGGLLLGTGMSNAAQTIGQQAQQAGSTWGNLLQGGARAFENYNKPAGATYDPSKYRVVPL